MRSIQGLIVASLLVGVVGCGPDETPPPEPTAESVALDLFALARTDDPDPPAVATTFGEIEDEQRYAGLLDAIRVMRADETPEIVGTYTLDGGSRTGFDLEAPVGGEGLARYSVLLDTTAPPGRIVWFSGPGIEWPERGRRGPGISTSAPPPSEGG